MAKATNNVIRGQTFKGLCHLKTVNAAGQNAQPYVIQVSDVITVHLPPDSKATPAVPNNILSSAVSGQVTPNFGTPGDVAFVCPSGAGNPSSGQMLVGQNLGIDVWVTHSDGTVDIFEAASVINVSDPLNP
jgi:hypothetical protein